MNKYIIALALSQTLFFAHATSVNLFTKLTPKIVKQANTWSEKVVNTVNDDVQLAFLNLFALNAENLIQAFIKAAEYIESQKNVLSLYEELGINIMETIKKYADNVQEKINLKKNITEKEKEALWKKLEIKIQELIAHINSIYYETLYKHMAKRNVSPLYMFDENGIIAPEKRTRSLPHVL